MNMMLASAFTTLILTNATTNGTTIPGSENGLIVALGGVIGIILFLTIILLRVLSKRKKRFA